MKVTWFIIVFICGALLPFQAGLNARLGKSIGSPVYASTISFVVGALAVAIYLQFTRETVTWAGLKSASIYSWLGGGITGAIFITATMIAIATYWHGAYIWPGGCRTGNCCSAA